MSHLHYYQLHSTTVLKMIETDKYAKDENIYCAQTIDLLASGLNALYVPPITNVKNQLKELTKKQSVMVDQLHNENLKIAWTQNSPELQEMFDMTKVYQSKLANIKKEMKMLHTRSMKLKKRALKLQQFVEKESYIRSQHK